jgi:hypothetical protein
MPCLGRHQSRVRPESGCPWMVDRFFVRDGGWEQIVVCHNYCAFNEAWRLSCALLAGALRRCHTRAAAPWLHLARRARPRTLARRLQINQTLGHRFTAPTDLPGGAIKRPPEMKGSAIP